MKDIVKTLFGLGITVGLSDRESFVKQVSTIIKEYQKDPEKADKWAHAVMSYFEQTRDSLNMQNAIKEAVADGPLPDKERIEELTNAIKELTKELKSMKSKT
jgi:polyhydroxyalkanoate synthesis regulator phasin